MEVLMIPVVELDAAEWVTGSVAAVIANTTHQHINALGLCGHIERRRGRCSSGQLRVTWYYRRSDLTPLKGVRKHEPSRTELDLTGKWCSVKDAAYRIGCAVNYVYERAWKGKIKMKKVAFSDRRRAAVLLADVLKLREEFAAKQQEPTFVEQVATGLYTGTHKAAGMNR